VQEGTKDFNTTEGEKYDAAINFLSLGNVKCKTRTFISFDNRYSEDLTMVGLGCTVPDQMIFQ
jgi:hypothetical protein